MVRSASGFSLPLTRFPSIPESIRDFETVEAFGDRRFRTSAWKVNNQIKAALNSEPMHDPQFIIQTELGRASVAAHAIEEQFALAKAEIQKQPRRKSWLCG